MNKHIGNYLNSFKLKKEFFYTLAADILFLAVIFSLFSFFGKIMEKKSALLANGNTPEQLRQLLLTMQPEQMQAFFVQMKSFIAFFIVGAIILAIITLFLFSLSRGAIWNKLLKKKLTKKTYWKWNAMNIALIIPLLIYFLGFIFIKIILNMFVSILTVNQTFLILFSDFINLLFLLLFLIFIFLVYYSFAERYKVWESMGNAFHLIKTKWKDIRPMFLLIVGTAIVLSLVLWPIGKLAYQQNILIGINLAVSLLFLAWMRIYVTKTIS